MTYSEIYKAFYEAAIQAIAATGDAYKNLSWFARNKKKAELYTLRLDTYI